MLDTFGSSDGLGMSLGVPSRLWEEFSFGKFPNIVARYEPLPSRLQTASACRFDGTNWLSVDEAAFTANGFTAGCMFRTSSATLQTLIFVGDKDAADEYQALRIDASQDLNATSVSNAAGAASATKAGSYADGAYHSAIMTVNSAGTSRKIYADSAVAVEETTTVTPGATYDRTTLGRTGDSTPTDYLIGDEDNAFIYRAEMTAAQVAWIVNSGSWRNWSEIGTNTVGLVAATFSCWWELDEESGVRTNKAEGFGGNAIHLSPAGNAKGMTFASASVEYASVASGVKSAPPLSMSCSFKTTALNPATNMGLTVVGNTNTDKAAMYITSGNKLVGFVDNGTASSQALSVASCTDQAWHFGAVSVATNGSVTTDLDGTSTSDASTVTPLAAYDNTAIATTNPLGTTQPFNGTQDNVAYWTIALSAAQRIWLRTGGIAGGPATYRDVVLSSHADNPGVGNVAAWYQLNEATGAATLVNVHNPGTYDLTTASIVDGPTSTTGIVTDLPAATDGTVTQQPGVEDRALENAVNARLSSSSATVSAFPLSIDCWLKCVGAESGVAFCVANAAATARLIVYVISGTVYGVFRQSSNNYTDAGSAVNDGNWHHVVVRVTSASVEVAVDGTPSGSPSPHSESMFTSGLVVIFDVKETDDLPFVGSVDECRVWDALLSDTDITELYNSGAGLLSQDLISGAEALTSGLVPIHAWPLNSNAAAGAGEDIGTTGGIDLTLTNAPTDAPGIPSGQALGAGGVVSQWTDQSGSNHLTQATWLNRPRIIAVSDGTGYALEFDGIDDYLATAAWSALSQPNTIILVASVRDTNSNQTLCDGIAAGNEASLQVNATGDVVTVDAGTPDDSALTIDYGNVHIWTAVINGASTTLYKDGGTGEVLSVGAETQTGLTIGALFDGTLPADCDYYCMIVNDGALTDSELNKIHQRLGSVYGVAVTNVA